MGRLVPTDVASWQRGAEAERAVGTKLATLEPLGFVTLFDRRIPSRGGNLDAVTVGPPGVFVIETRHRRRGVEVIQGRFEVNGYGQADVVRQVTDQAMLIQISAAELMNHHRLTVVPISASATEASRGANAPAGSW